VAHAASGTVKRVAIILAAFVVFRIATLTPLGALVCRVAELTPSRSAAPCVLVGYGCQAHEAAVGAVST
jgi:hypothetical protein